MEPQSSDTSPDAERIQIGILRAMPPWKRLLQVDELYATTTGLAMADLRRQHPEAAESELRVLLLERVRLAWQLEEAADPGAHLAPASER